MKEKKRIISTKELTIQISISIRIESEYTDSLHESKKWDSPRHVSHAKSSLLDRRATQKSLHGEGGEQSANCGFSDKLRKPGLSRQNQAAEMLLAQPQGGINSDFVVESESGTPQTIGTQNCESNAFVNPENSSKQYWSLSFRKKVKQLADKLLYCPKVSPWVRLIIQILGSPLIAALLGF